MSLAWRTSRIGVLVCSAILFAAVFNTDVSHAGGTGGVTAHAAKAEALNQTLYFKVTKIRGSTIEAEGHSNKEPVSGNIGFRLTLLNASRARADFSGTNGGGSMRGVANVSYHVSGVMSYFSGAVASFSGTRKYAHAKTLGVSFQGTLNRKTFALTITLRGRWSH